MFAPGESVASPTNNEADIKESPMTLVELNGVHSFSVGQRVVVGDTTHNANANTNNGMKSSNSAGRRK